MGNKGRKSKKRRKNQATLSLFISPTPLNLEMGYKNAGSPHQKPIIFWKKNYQKSLHKRFRAVALILAFIAISKPRGQKSKK